MNFGAAVIRNLLKTTLTPSFFMLHCNNCIKLLIKAKLKIVSVWYF